jgi:hypothetical protein
MTHRKFSDDHGTSWEAWDVRPSTVESTLRGLSPSAAQHPRGVALPPDMREGWLAFQCGDESRRLAPIPSNWASLSDGELSQLADVARPIVRRQAKARGGPPTPLVEPGAS